MIKGKNMKATIKTLFIILWVITVSSAQELITDRPDYTESAQVIPAKMIQIESGFEYSDFYSIEELSFPNALARIGVGYNLELRLGFLGWISNNSNYYLNDLLLELKYRITDEQSEFPIALMLVSTLPTGDSKVSVGDPEIGIKAATGYDINDQFEIGINFGSIYSKGEDEPEFLNLASAALGIGISDKLGMFLELFAEMPGNDVWQPVLDGGFTFLITDQAQLDFYVGKGLNDYSPDLIIGAGLSVLFGY